jgi:hypothetical protein
MKSVVYFLAITLLTSGLATANPATAGLGRVRGRDGASYGDEGVRFTCDHRQIREIKSGMGDYLKSLDIPEEAVSLRERPAQGVLVYTLATPAQETSTLDLATRPAMGITDQVSLPLSNEVFQWRYAVFSRPRDVGKRQPLTEQDLESLGAAPRHGGIVTDWRIGPDFFSVPVRHNTASRQQTALDRS